MIVAWAEISEGAADMARAILSSAVSAKAEDAAKASKAVSAVILCVVISKFLLVVFTVTWSPEVSGCRYGGTRSVF
jgi:hypothetical protein